MLSKEPRVPYEPPPLLNNIYYNLQNIHINFINTKEVHAIKMGCQILL